MLIKLVHTVCMNKHTSCFLTVIVFILCCFQRNLSADELSSRTYELNIYFVEQEKKCLIKFPGTKTIRQAGTVVVLLGYLT